MSVVLQGKYLNRPKMHQQIKFFFKRKNIGLCPLECSLMDLDLRARDVNSKIIAQG